MKLFFVCAAAAAFCWVLPLCGCSGKIDYFDYVSELRRDVYMYEDDGLSLFVHCVEREQPFVCDGFCGNVCSFLEVFATFEHNPDGVEISLCGQTGEMNFEAAKGRYQLTLPYVEPKKEGIEVALKYGKTQKDVVALSVNDGGVLPPEKILECVKEHSAELFGGLTEGKNFKGEIFIRLLYDDGCYYYVGVCDRQKNITAHLVDGGLGKILATKNLKA